LFIPVVMMSEIRSGLSHRANPNIHRPSRNARQHTAPATPSANAGSSGSRWDAAATADRLFGNADFSNVDLHRKNLRT
jgi:hypothetical protein